MPLPGNDQVWPPPVFKPAFDLMAEHDAWYKGDVDSLSKVYASGTQRREPSPSQVAGGLVGAVARFFWGRPIPTGQSRSKVHIPVAADIATTSADLLFAEPPRLILPKGTASVESGVVTPSKSQDRLNLIFNDPVTQAELLEGAELSAALSGTYLRMVWDKDLADHVLVDAVASDSAIPEWRFGQLAAVTFWNRVRTDGSRVWRHLERHELGAIVHGLYEGTVNNLGHPVPFEDDESTAWIAQAEGLVNGDTIPTGVPTLTATFIPNIRPQRRWRETPQLAPYGRSDFDTIEGIFDAIDEVWSSWLRDIRLAKSRLIVPSQYIQNRGFGEGGSFDTDQELFTPLDYLGKGADGAPITPHQFLIRWEEHQETIKSLTRQALRSAGYSAASFGDDSITVSKTATEVHSDERLSNRTRDKKARYWKAGLGPFARTLLNLDAAVFGTGAGTDDLPEVRFTEESQQDTLELAQTSNLLRQAEAASTVVLVRMNHPDWEAEMVDEEVKRIQEEKKASAALAPDPALFRGDGVDAQDPADPSNSDTEV